MVERYGIPPASVAVIPHGVPDLPFIDPAGVKHRFGLAGRTVVLGFGLLGPNKRYEMVIEAMARIVAQRPGGDLRHRRRNPSGGSAAAR